MKNFKSVIVGIVIGGVLFGGATYFMTKQEYNKKLVLSKEEFEGTQKESSNKDNSEEKISEEKAKEIMLSEVPGGKIIEFGYDGDERIPCYDGTIVKDKIEYEFSVDAKTGVIIDSEKDINLKNKKDKDIKEIGEEKAKKIMIDKVGGGEFIEFKFDKDDKIPNYEGSILKDKIEYDIKINAETGKIIEFEKDLFEIN